MTHAAFASAGAEHGLQVWRIEDFEPVPYPKADYGKFYTGDSYIVLYTLQRGGCTSWNVHFWLGAATSQDEAGAAALLTVQLDDALGGAPVQYREVQEHETQLFLSYFNNGVRYVPGGVASGFHHVDHSVEKRLFQVKGKKNIRIKQVEVSVGSMNRGDCFLLDAGDTIYVYVGSQSKRMERLKAISAANLIRDQDHAGRATVVVVDEFSSEGEVSEFFGALGSGSAGEVADASAGGDDAAFEAGEERAVALYKVSDAAGDLQVAQVAQKPLTQDMLDTNDCFILDGDRGGLYVWIGRGCTGREKAEAMGRAQAFLAARQRPAFTRVQRVVQAAEPSAFRQYFAAWSDEAPPARVLRAHHCKLLANQRLQTTDIDDIEQEDLDEDDVIIVETSSTVFVWFGKDSSEEERSRSMMKAGGIKRRGNQDNIEQVEQGAEPEEFTSLFPDWNPEFWNTMESYEQRRNAAMNA